MGIRVTVEGIRSRVPSIILALTMIGALGVLGYTLVSPKAGEGFTEFYILGQEGEAIDYPDELKVGEGGKVVVGIINQEGETATYWVEVAIEGVKSNEVGLVTLGNGEKWEGIVSFTPDKVGDRQKVEFLLYRRGWDGVYRRLHLWVDVH